MSLAQLIVLLVLEKSDLTKNRQKLWVKRLAAGG